MDILNIVIDDLNYTYVDSINLDEKNYVVYTDGKTTYISEYKITNNNLELFDINDEIFNKVKEVLNL